MLRYITALIAAAFLCLPALAADRTFSWDAPTEYVDGSPLPLEELERYELGCGPVAGERAADVRTWITTPSDTRVEDFGIGTHYCALRVKAITNASQVGDWSAWSNEVSFTVAPPVMAPVAPMNLAVSSSD